VNTTLTLDKKIFQDAAAKARKLGQTPKAYVESLIAQADRTFDDIVAPVRQAFEGTPDDELDSLLSRANRAARKRMKGRK
jgi:hypothetical protein